MAGRGDLPCIRWPSCEGRGSFLGQMATLCVCGVTLRSDGHPMEGGVTLGSGAILSR